MDTHFLVYAAEISRKEFSLGQLADQTDTISPVIELGKRMEDEYTKSLKTSLKKAFLLASSPPFFLKKSGVFLNTREGWIWVVRNPLKNDPAISIIKVKPPNA